ncbi:hypothetical protein [Fibrobacter sp. UWB7]|uniref:hypothetical protein n=1 Tax=Fibrobacter sp. UWB7 TaxID=1896206 RepID=UPI00091EB624|nr:hypothetical protein [Fibrobacter sp. UWB7]SHM21323.1 hypothetical protein SAMN05720467_0957 [Fibrobacter sp. UWB7]
MIPTFIIEWKGPYKKSSETNQTNILYLITGSSKAGRPCKKIRYIGKTGSGCRGRFNKSHPFSTMVGKDKEFWIGRIKKSKSAKKDSSAISRAEKILVHYLTAYKTSFLIDLLNERLKNEPQKAFGVVNRWFKKNGKEYEKYLFPFNLIPDIILWESSKDVLISSDKLYIEKDVE